MRFNFTLEWTNPQIKQKFEFSLPKREIKLRVKVSVSYLYETTYHKSFMSAQLSPDLVFL